MSDSRAPVPSPVLGIVALVVAAGLIALVLRSKSPQTTPPDPSANTPADTTPDTSTPSGGTSSLLPDPSDSAAPGQTGTQPTQTTPEPPAPFDPQRVARDVVEVLKADPTSLASTLVTIPAEVRPSVATATLVAIASDPSIPPAAIVTLLSAGADVNARTEGGRTPIMLACASGDIDKVFAFLDAGAKAWARDDEGMDPREHALAREDQRGYDIAAVLEEARMD